MLRGVGDFWVEVGVFEVRNQRAASRAVLSLGIDVARWYEDHMRTAPRTLGQQHADLVLRMLGAKPV